MKSHLTHITEINSERLEQTVIEHSFHVADYAAEKLKGIDLWNTAYLAGLLHDMGKCTAKYREYLSRASAREEMIHGNVNHTFYECIYLLKEYHIGRPQGMDTVTCEILVYAIGAHHGQFDCVMSQSTSEFEHRLEEDPKEISCEEAVSTFLSEYVPTEEVDRSLLLAQQEISVLFETFRTRSRKNRAQVNFLMGLAARMILSIVIDGDHRDTAESMIGMLQKYRGDSDHFWARQVTHFEQKSSYLQAQTPINTTRSGFSEQYRIFTQQHGGGIYRLTLPTGAGETLLALRYTLYHAKAFHKKRVLFVVPLPSILEQNSTVIRSYIQDKNSLTEHYPNVVKLFDTGEKLDQYEFLTDTWELPIVITTLVQLLSALFLGKANAVRRVSALSQAVIVAGEVQSLPKEAMNLFTMALNFLACGCGATVVLFSMTTPCFKQTDFPLQYADPVEIVPYRPNNFEVFKRTEIINKTSPYGVSVEGLADFSVEVFSHVSSLLLICNTKESALRLCRELEHRCNDCRVFHLSTSVCMAHRTDTLRKINAVLKSGEKTVCVSTQLMETGVDFSFESIIHAATGMDNIAQTTSRCNRSNDFGGIRPVHVVNFNQGTERLGVLREIAAAQRCALQLLCRFTQSPNRYAHDLLSGENVTGYYQFLFQDVDIKGKFGFLRRLPDGTTEDLFDLLAVDLRHIEQPEFQGKYFLNQAFLTTRNLFQVFNENTTGVIVPYNVEAKELIADLFSQQSAYDLAFPKRCIEKTKLCTIQVFQYQVQELSNYGMLSFTHDDRFTVLNEQCYDDKTSLIIENLIY